jgi:RNA polymerase sigma-70 factor (ECF subfamily)
MSEAADFQPAELELQRAFLQRLARQLVRGEAAAEDLVQETFLLALQHPPASATVLRSWLTRVARHLAINRGRGEQRALARERRAARSEALPSHDEALASLELQERLIAAVKSLAEPYRTTLWLRFHEGLAPGAIAEQQETTKKTIESRLTRGLAQLRTELDRQAGGDRRQWLGGMLVLARGPVAPWVASLIGVGVMQKFVLVAVTLVVFGLAWRLVPRSEKAPTGEVASHVAAVPETAPLPATPTEAHRAALALEQIPASADAAASGLLVHVRWADGTPASDVGLILHPEDDPRGERAVLRLTTDAGGLAHVASIAAGRVRVEADRGGERTFVVAAQGRTEVVFDLAAGVDVEGTVLDTAGAPLAGAEVLLVSAALDWLERARDARLGEWRLPHAGVQTEFR